MVEWIVSQSQILEARVRSIKFVFCSSCSEPHERFARMGSVGRIGTVTLFFSMSLYFCLVWYFMLSYSNYCANKIIFKVLRNRSKTTNLILFYCTEIWVNLAQSINLIQSQHKSTHSDKMLKTPQDSQSFPRVCPIGWRPLVSTECPVHFIYRPTYGIINCLATFK